MHFFPENIGVTFLLYIEPTFYKEVDTHIYTSRKGLEKYVVQSSNAMSGSCVGGLGG